MCVCVCACVCVCLCVCVCGLPMLIDIDVKKVVTRHLPFLESQDNLSIDCCWKGWRIFWNKPELCGTFCDCITKSGALRLRLLTRPKALFWLRFLPSLVVVSCMFRRLLAASFHHTIAFLSLLSLFFFSVSRFASSRIHVFIFQTLYPALNQSID